MTLEQLSSEDEIRKKVLDIESIPTGVAPRAEAILVLFGEKPAAEMYLPDKINAQKVIDILRNIGLFAEITREDDESCYIGLSLSPELLEELINTRSNKDHRRYGELMGYPSTAIDAFLGENGTERLSPEEQDFLTKDLPDVLVKFVLSKKHHKDELGHLHRWFKLVAKEAPELIDQLYKKDTAKRFKDYIATLE
jgi:hypothetical protein